MSLKTSLVMILSAFKVDKSVDAMTNRARVYFYTGGGRHALTGLTILFLPWLYSGAAFVPIFNLLSLSAWGWIMTVAGVLCCWAAFNRNGDLARFGIVLSATITAVIALGLWLGIGFVWAQWLTDVGSIEFWKLVLDRPSQYPPYLKIVTAIIPPSPFLPIAMTAFVIKDFTMCAQPLRVPLEERIGVRPLGV